MSLITIKNLTKKFKNTTVLKDVNLEIPSGKNIGLLGPNGAGKTTLIKLLNDLLTPTTGEIRFKNHLIGVESKLKISYLPEKTYLNPNFTVQETLDFFQDFYPNFSLEKAKRLLKDLELDPAQKLSKMSKGMQEKVQLILVMSRKADLYILDEPLSGVDPATRSYILDTILANRNPSASLLISTHLISDVEHILDEIIVLKNGKILEQIDTKTLRKKSKTSIDQYFRQTFEYKKGAKNA